MSEDVDSLGAPWWRSTGLHREMAYVGGTLYASGGLLVLLTVLVPSWDLYRPWWVTAVGVIAVAVGLFYLWSAERLPMPLWQYSIATSLGAMLVTLAVFGGGPQATATLGVLYVFVSTYGFYYYPWPLAWWFVVLNGAGFAAALVFHDVEAALVQWLTIVGVSVIAGGLIGTAGRRVRGLLTTEQANVELLSERDQWKTTFLRAVSHDLRAPLSTMLGLLMLIRDSGHRMEAQQRELLVSRAVASGERLQRLLTDLLDLERIEAGDVSPRLELTPLDELVRTSLAALDLDGRIIHTDLEPVTAPVEPSKIDRIVANLVSNATRHTPDEARVWVRVREEDRTAVLIVEDNGPGLPDDVRATLFQAFGGGNGSGPGAPGSGRVGLGLHLVLRFTELHGGQVIAKDAEGGGACFEVRLPLGQP